MTERFPAFRGLIPLLLALVLSACAGASSPRYYTLAPVASGAPAAEAVMPARIVVGPVNLPDYLDRRPIVTRDNAYAIRLATSDYWAAPLQDQVPRVLVADLATRLPADHIEAFPQLSGSAGDYRVAVDIDRFDVDASGLATLTVHWWIYGRTAPQALQAGETTLHQQAEATDYEAGAAALSATLGALADSLAQSLTQLRLQAPLPLAGS